MLIRIKNENFHFFKNSNYFKGNFFQKENFQKKNLDSIKIAEKFDPMKNSVGNFWKNQTTKNGKNRKSISGNLKNLKNRQFNSLISIPTAIAEKKFLISSENFKKINRPLSRMDIFYSGSLQKLPEFQLQFSADRNLENSQILMIDGMNCQNGMNSFEEINSFEGINSIERMNSSEGIEKNEQILPVLKSILDFGLFKSPSFLILAISGFCTLSGFYVPFIYLPHYAQKIGIEEKKATLLVSILGFTNISSRIVCGWLSDRPKMNALMINNVALTIAGLATIFLPHLDSYWSLSIYCVLFGFGTGKKVFTVNTVKIHLYNN